MVNLENPLCKKPSYIFFSNISFQVVNYKMNSISRKLVYCLKQQKKAATTVAMLISVDKKRDKISNGHFLLIWYSLATIKD